MRFAGFRTKRMIAVASGMEMLFGLSIYLFPAEFTATTYDPLRPYFPLLSALLLVGGVVLLMLIQYRPTGWLRRAIGLLPFAPTLPMAWFFGHDGHWSGILQYSMLALAVLALTWLPVKQAAPDEGRRLDLADMMLGLLFLAIGVFALGGYMGISYRPLQSWLPFIGLLGLVSGAIFLLSALEVKPFAGRSPWRYVGFLLCLILIYNFAKTGIWTGIMAWGVWAAAIVLRDQRYLVDLMEPVELQVPPADMPDQLPIYLEQDTEWWLWLLGLIVVFLTALGIPGMVNDPAVPGFFIVATALYNLLAFRFFKRVGTPDGRIRAHLFFLTLAMGMLIIDEGMLSKALLVPFLMMIPLAARVSGTRTGLQVMFLSLLMIGSREGYEIIRRMEPSQAAASDTVLEFLGAITVTILGISSAKAQHRSLKELVATRANLQQQIQQMALIEQISAAVSSSLDIDTILQTTVDELGRATSVSRCAIRLCTENTMLPIRHQYVVPGVDPLPADFVATVLANHVLEDHQPVLVADATADSRLAPAAREKFLESGIRAMLVAPIMAEGDLLGLISFHQCDSPRTWTEEEQHFLEAIAGQVAVALVHGRSHEVLRESLSELQLAHQDLQQTHEELQHREDELLTQREELQAQHEELLDQSATLQAQQNQLESLLAHARTVEAAQRRLVDILEASPDLVGMSDAQGRRMYMNRAGRHLLGYDDDDDLSNQSIYGVHPDWAREIIVNEGIPTAVRDGYWRGENALLTRDGREIPVSQVLVAHRASDGEVTRFSTIVRDISDRKLAELAMKESEERFRTAFDSAPIGMILNELDGTPLQVNAALRELLGYSETELLADDRPFINLEDRMLCDEQMPLLLTGQIRSIQHEQRYTHKSGYVITTLRSVAILRDGAGKPRYMLAQVQDITERKRYENQLMHMANFDPLTDMFNRRRFEEELEHHLRLAGRYGATGALLFLDLDQFKYVNDSLGHQAGDLFLKGMAAMLRDRLRKSDIIARLGGDEFAILLPQTAPEQAGAVADEIRKAVRRYSQVIGSETISTTCSVGIAIFPDHGTTVEELLARADQAMYQAKEHGRNQHFLFQPGTTEQEQVTAKLTWERRIRWALEHDGLVLHWQPILNLSRGEISQYELLLRMKGEDGQLIRPGSFLDVAERFGLIRPIDRWVVKEAIHLLADLHRRTPNTSLEVNISGRSFDDPQLLTTIEEELRATGVNPGALVMEITETAAIAHIDQAKQFVERLRALGCRFAIDDFGAGFSSFYYLKHLPVDYLKIDGSFVQHLPTDPVDQHLVRAMVEVAKGLGKKTIAEFVEDAETVRLLKEYGVDFAQGYYIGLPIPIDA